MKENWIGTIGVSMGDAAGIGAELVAKAAAKGLLSEGARTVIVGDERQLLRGMKAAGVSFCYEKAANEARALERRGLILLDTGALDADAFPYGEEDPALGFDAGGNLKRCVEACRKGLFDAVCFAPNNKAALKHAGFRLNGAVDLLADFFGCTGYRSELGVLGGVWTARVTSHIPHREVGGALTADGILDSARLLDRSMRGAGFRRPRIAVAALNPHGGEAGTCGREEIDVIRPAVERGKAEGLDLTGPLPADTLFFRLFRGDFDGAVTMYHDQGQIAMKLRGFDKGVTVFGGMPNPVTTCSHGSAFDIAGKGIADSGSWEQAFLLAKRMAETIHAARKGEDAR